ncbi:MAG TPA: hypothetical protein VFI84_00875 [Candidatus Saccharimonadales bacterium]|nr:hypothetical protein [Candidatus Saccharimonadales bacterium]
MIVVGITGGIGHGKTTFADYLAGNARKAEHLESSDVILEVANALRHESPVHPKPDNLAAINRWLMPLMNIIPACVHCASQNFVLPITPAMVADEPLNYTKLFEYLKQMAAEPTLQTVEITKQNRQQFRSLLQWLGGYLVKKVDEGIWYDEIVRRIRNLSQNGTEIVIVGGVRFPGDAERLRNAGGAIVEIRRPSVAEVDVKDLTERERNLIVPDTVVVNDGSLADLAQCAPRVYRGLQLRELEPTYYASQTSLL